MRQEYVQDIELQSGHCGNNEGRADSCPKDLEAVLLLVDCLVPHSLFHSLASPPLGWYLISWFGSSPCFVPISFRPKGSHSFWVLCRTASWSVLLLVGTGLVSTLTSFPSSFRTSWTLKLNGGFSKEFTCSNHDHGTACYIYIYIFETSNSTPRIACRMLSSLPC